MTKEKLDRLMPDSNKITVFPTFKIDGEDGLFIGWREETILTTIHNKYIFFVNFFSKIENLRPASINSKERPLPPPNYFIVDTKEPSDVLDCFYKKAFDANAVNIKNVIHYGFK